MCPFIFKSGAPKRKKENQNSTEGWEDGICLGLGMNYFFERDFFLFFWEESLSLSLSTWGILGNNSQHRELSFV